jgi:hypothetical protein
VLVSARDVCVPCRERGPDMTQLLEAARRTLGRDGKQEVQIGERVHAHGHFLFHAGHGVMAAHSAPQPRGVTNLKRCSKLAGDGSRATMHDRSQSAHRLERPVRCNLQPKVAIVRKHRQAHNSSVRKLV